MMEFLLYGLAKDSTELWQEELLYVGTTREQLDTIEQKARADGWHTFRRSCFTPGELPNFAGTINV